MTTAKKFLVFGAHPDDPDLMFGGTAIKLIKAGHQVKFVSMTNGDAGHFAMNPQELAKRRYDEAQASAKIAGLYEYQILDIHDGNLELSLENRKKIVKIIREFNPDIVLSHRTNDYHPDHRATGQLVQDASYLIRVPLYCPETPIPENWPIFAYCWDTFRKPCPFQPDVIVKIDDVIETKFKMIDCHKSQFYEWLPWDLGIKDFDCSKMTLSKIKDWIDKNWFCENRRQVELYYDKVKEIYKDETDNIKYVESFEISEYGRIPSNQEIKELFPI